MYFFFFPHTVLTRWTCLRSSVPSVKNGILHLSAGRGQTGVKELRMGISSLKMPGTKAELRKGPSKHRQQLGVRGDPFKGQSLHLEEEGCYTFPP